MEKVLIVPDYGAGRILCETLARAGGGWVNLRPETITGLAQRIAGEYMADQNIKLVTGYPAYTIVEEVYSTMQQKGAMKYYTRRGCTDGLVKAIASSIFELRKCGITAGSLSADSFVNQDKGTDMVALLQAYQDYLKEHNYIDAPGIWAIALNMLSFSGPSPDRDIIYLLPTFLSLYPLEEQFVRATAGDALITVIADPVYGLGMTGVRSPEFADVRGSASLNETQRLPWLYSVAYSPPPVGDGSVSYFQAYGITNEVKEVIRRVHAGEIPLDNVTVGYTSSDYIPVFYRLAKRIGLGLTVEEGIPGFFTSPGRVLAGLIEWLGSGFAVATLKDLLLSGDARLTARGDTGMSPLAAARILRSAGIGWGRERYVLLQGLAESLKERAALQVGNGDNEDRRERLLQQSERTARLFSSIEQLLMEIPVPNTDGKVAFRELTAGLSSILSSITIIKEEIDVAALISLVANLNLAGQLASFDLDMDEALERVKSLLDDFRVGASGPKPGHIHLTGYANLVWSYRPYTFLVGLDANTFPGGVRQDPVLLDDERVLIHPGLPLGTNRPGENQYSMALSLASLRGRVVLSFASYDVVENRSVYPSSLLLQVHRLLHRDASLDYTHLINSLGKTSGYCPQAGKPVLDELEWWLQRALMGAGTGGLAAIKHCYKNIELGMAAQIARQSAEPTEYDGIIDLSGACLDPRNNPGLVVSSSVIEELAGCPFAFFLRHVLGISPPEDTDYDPGRWLDALERGTLLHELFCNFMCRVTSNGVKPSLASHRSMMMEMADELVDSYKQRVPPPSQVVFDREVADIYRCCELFLTGEEGETSTPVYFEVPFGMGSRAVAEAGCGLADPVEVKLMDGSIILLRGKIDRIDRIRDNVYSVWDYKTGGTYGYEDHQFLRRGRQLQHALYAIAAEQVISHTVPGSSPRVEISGYYFPTEKGEGRRVSRVQSDQVILCQALSHLFDLMAVGTFVAAEDGDKCTFCDYRQVCNQPRATARSRELVNGRSTCLGPWRRLKEIE